MHFRVIFVRESASQRSRSVARSSAAGLA